MTVATVQIRNVTRLGVVLTAMLLLLLFGTHSTFAYKDCLLDPDCRNTICWHWTDICGDGGDCKPKPNEYPYYQCVCKPGYMTLGDESCVKSPLQVSPAGTMTMGGSCLDDTECGPNAICDLIGGNIYMCRCEDGYVGDGFFCMKAKENPSSPAGSEAGKDVCTNDSDCGANGGCFHVGGDIYKCECNDGYSGDGYSCTEDVDGANNVSPLSSAQGSNTAGSSGGGTCVNDSDCDINGGCYHVSGDVYKCECNDGFVGNGYSCSILGSSNGSDPTLPEVTPLSSAGTGAQNSDGPTCVNDSDCDINGGCYHVSGDVYKCECNDGFVGNGITCSMIGGSGSVPTPPDNIPPEVFPLSSAGTGAQGSDGPICVNDSDCDINGGCYHVSGDVYKCECNDGFVGNGITCSMLGGSGGSDPPPPEVAPLSSAGTSAQGSDGPSCVNDSDCDINGGCYHVSGDIYKCECNDGFVGNGITCSMIGGNGGSDPTPPEVTPLSSAGTGAQGSDGPSCVNDSDCDINGGCYHVSGDVYKCECNDGFVGNGITCLMIGGTGGSNPTPPEVTPLSSAGTGAHNSDGPSCTNDSDCDINGGCYHVSGDVYKCECNDGFVGNGVTCSMIGGTGGSDPTPPEVTPLSAAGTGVQSSDGPSCANDSDCDINGGCYHVSGDVYKCECNDGFVGNGISCAMIGGSGGSDPTPPEVKPLSSAGTGAENSDSPSCVNDSDCDINGGCYHVSGDVYKCECNDGFVGNGISCAMIGGSGGSDPTPPEVKPLSSAGTGAENSDSPSCVNDSDCDINGGCYHVSGDVYKCECNDGFVGNGITCSMIVGGSGGSIPTPPEVTPPSSAGTGAQGSDGPICVNDSDCDINGGCYHVSGDVYKCECNDGFVGNGITCTMPGAVAAAAPAGGEQNVVSDSNIITPSSSSGTGAGENDGSDNNDNADCVDDSDCDINAGCYHIMGDVYKCECNNGFVGNGFSCSMIGEDVGKNKDEKTNPNPPVVVGTTKGVNGDDNNGNGGGSGGSCLDDSECDVNAGCYLIGGGVYQCECNDGFAGDGYSCKAVGEGGGTPNSNAGITVSTMSAAGDGNSSCPSDFCTGNGAKCVYQYDINKAYCICSDNSHVGANQDCPP